MKNRKEIIFDFVVRHKTDCYRAFKLTLGYGGYKTDAGKLLLKKARKEIGYSPKTSGGDIYIVLWRMYKSIVVDGIESSQEQPLSPYKGRTVYDEQYLNECIEKATPRLSKIKDVDEYLRELRGGEPKLTDEEIEKWAAGKVNEIDPDEYGYGDLLIEGAKWARDKK